MSAHPPSPPYVPVAWHRGRVRLLDQTRLPEESLTLDLVTVEEVAEAITTMRVRGAPAIGVTAAYGLALAAALAPGGGVHAAIEAAAGTLGATRPTAVNLRWALDRVRAAVAGAPDGQAAATALSTALAIHEAQRDADRAAALAGA
ncbi:MAG: S-methyl-5-thioribose-1-phosphate isomerase, partial [Dehalococcoidia bacterium]|nr:S-methyl-5-thioribose-1-phosphate isomerase [Dehalococcoidia bacterium]